MLLRSKTRPADIIWHARKPIFQDLQSCKMWEAKINASGSAVSRSSIPGAAPDRACCSSLLKICFDDLGAHRVELFVFEDNERAHRAYLKNGFVEEGIVRDIHRDAEGTFRSMRLMSLLRPEWQRPA